MNTKKIEREVGKILGRLEFARQSIELSGQGLELKKVLPHFKSIRDELISQRDALIEEANKPIKPRSAKKILEALAESGEMSEDLLAEIKESLKEKDK